MPTAPHDAGVAVQNDIIYLVGGNATTNSNRGSCIASAAPTKERGTVLNYTQVPAQGKMSVMGIFRQQS